MIEHTIEHTENTCGAYLRPPDAILLFGVVHCVFALCVVINHRWVGLDAWATKPAALTPAHPHHHHHHHHPLSFLR